MPVIAATDARTEAQVLEIGFFPQHSLRKPKDTRISRKFVRRVRVWSLQSKWCEMQKRIVLTDALKASSLRDILGGTDSSLTQTVPFYRNFFPVYGISFLGEKFRRQAVL